MATCIRKELIFISREEVERREKRELEKVAESEILLQPNLIGETRTTQEQYENRLRELLEEKDADCILAPKFFTPGKDHLAIFYRDNKQRGKIDAYAGRIPCC